MAISRVAEEEASGTSVVSIATSLATVPTAGNDMIVGVTGIVIATPAPTITVSDNQGNTYNSQVEVTDSTGRMGIFRATNISTGTPFTITVTYNTTVDGGLCQYIEYSGLDQSAAVETNSNGATSTDPSTGAVDPGVSVTALYYAFGANTFAGALWTEDVGWTEFLGGGGADAHSSIEQIGALGSENGGWTLDASQPWVAAIIAIDEAAVTHPGYYQSRGGWF